MGLPTLGIKTALRYIGLVPEVDWVTPQLALGGRARKWRLKRAGVTHILNTRKEPDEKIKGIRNFHNPTKDDRRRKDGDYWARSVEWGLEVLKDPKARLYIHCSAGVHRASATTYAILLAQGVDRKTAWKLIKKARPKVKSVYLKDVDLWFISR